MQGGTRIVVIVILLGLIVAAGVFLTRRMGRGEMNQPDRLLDRRVERIDSESLELVTKPRREWKRLGQKDGKYKNPKTDKYTMVVPAICASCGQKIPMSDVALATPGAASDRPLEPEEHLEAMKKQEALIKEWRCPRCGGYAAPSGMPIMPDQLGPRGPSPQPK